MRFDHHHQRDRSAPHLLTDAVNVDVSTIATIPEVRRQLVSLQRSYAEEYDSVMEGRDIGSTVFPDTPFKFYIDASAEVRALRRQRQGLHDSIGWLIVRTLHDAPRL